VSPRKKAGGIPRGHVSTPFFVSLCKRFAIPEPVREFKFAKALTPSRQWRFDYAWVDAKVALEVEGGVWIEGRHSRGKGMIEDMQKYNTATLNGWRVLRVTPDKLTDVSTLRMIGAVLGVEISSIGTL
jgi:hypothetical protein